MSVKILAYHILLLVTLALGNIPSPCGTPADICHAPIQNRTEHYVKAGSCFDVRTHADQRSLYPKGCQAETILTTDKGYRFECKVQSFGLAPGGSLLFDGGAIQTCLAGATCPPAVFSPYGRLSLAFDGGSDQGQGFNIRCSAVASPCGQCAAEQVEEKAPYVFDSASLSPGCQCNLRVTTKPDWSVRMAVEEQANTDGVRQSLRGQCQGPMPVNESLPNEAQDGELYLSLTAPQRTQKAHYRISFTAVAEQAVCATTTPTPTTSAASTKRENNSSGTIASTTEKTLASTTDKPSSPITPSGKRFLSTTTASAVTVPLQLSDLPIEWIVIAALAWGLSSLASLLIGWCWAKRCSPCRPKPGRRHVAF